MVLKVAAAKTQMRLYKQNITEQNIKHKTYIYIQQENGMSFNTYIIGPLHEKTGDSDTFFDFGIFTFLYSPNCLVLFDIFGLRMTNIDAVMDVTRRYVLPIVEMTSTSFS